MKLCDKCGAKNATRAQFCSTCGERFRITDASSEAVESYALKETSRTKRVKATLDAKPVDLEKAPIMTSVPKTAAKEVDVPVVKRVPERDDDADNIGKAAAKFGVSLGKFLLALLKYLAHLVLPFVCWILEGVKSTIARALGPTSGWDPNRPPNFLYWALVQFLVFQLPFAVVGLVYAVLANAARDDEDFRAARLRAEHAKNWLLFDLVVGIVISVFRTLVLK